MKLTFLGAWDTPPFFAWPWHTDKAINHFKKLTGFELKFFTYLKDNLHYQYFYSSGVNKLYKYFGGLTNTRKLNYIKRLTKDYYSNAKKVECLYTKYKNKNLKKLKKSEFATIISEFHQVLPLLTMPIWFVVLLDIWYPKFKEQIKVKNIGLKARDKCDRLVFGKVNVFLEKILKEIERRNIISKANILYLVPQELTKILKNKAVPITIIKSRKKLYVTTITNGQYQISDGPEAKTLLKKHRLAPHRVKPAKVLKGQPACRGKVQGRVHKVLLHNEFAKFKKGEILVALQTTVLFVPIMKKAWAILTEYGGITSHASVVSREMNKPCIVGIKGLTDSLNNGDLVEVDAEKGIVKIL